tara:strand:- start:1747 stop:2622 length:876 start_codon:yes stop_codon:yes gene_type:complete
MVEDAKKVHESWSSSWWYHPWIRFVLGLVTMIFVLIFQVLESGFEPFLFVTLSILLIVPLERIMPRHQIKTFRPQLLTDFFHHFVSGFIGFVPLIFLYPILGGFQFQSLSSVIQSQPIWLQILEALVLSEFLVYWGHRFSHEVPLLWRFHSVHHSSENLDWLAGERRHPIDQFYMSLFVGIPMVLSGFSLVDLLIVGVLQNLWDMTIHANLRWRLKFLDGIWVTSEFHHWHHSVDKDARDKNYSGALPIFDWLFRTYHLPSDKKPGPYGIDSHMPETYVGQLIQPFVLPRN